MIETLPRRERYQKAVDDLLRLGGMTRRHPDYKFFRVLLVGVCDSADRHNRAMRRIGKQLLELTSGDVAADRIESIRKFATGLGRFYVSPDINAVRGIHQAIKARVKRVKSNKNLRRQTNSVTDGQIRSALKAHRTRAEQAARLGITERQLLRRLKMMGVTSDRMS